MAKIIEIQAVKAAVDNMKSRPGYKMITLETLQGMPNRDPELNSFEEGDTCDLTGYTVEDLLEVIGGQIILDPGQTTPREDQNPAPYLLLPFKDKNNNEVVKQFFLGSLKKRVQEVDPVTFRNTNVVKTNALSIFRNMGNMADVLKYLAGKTIKITRIKSAVNPRRDRNTRQIIGSTPTTVMDFDLEGLGALSLQDYQSYKGTGESFV